MPLPAMQIQGLNLPGIYKAQQGIRTGQLQNRLLSAQLKSTEDQTARDTQVAGLRGEAYAGNESAAAMLASIDPKALKEVTDAREGWEEAKVEGSKRNIQMAMSILGPIMQMPPEQRPMAWKQALAQASQRGLRMENIPGLTQQDVSPQFVPGMAEKLGLKLGAAWEALQEPAKPSGAMKKVQDSNSETGWSWQSPSGERMTGAPPPTGGQAVSVRDGEVYVGPTTGMPTKAQAGKHTLDLEDQRVNVINFAKAGHRLLMQLQEEGAETLSFTGALERTLDSVVSQGKGFASAWGDKGKVSKWVQDFKWSSALAGESAAVRSKIASLAYALALAKNGTRPTDQDVDHALQMLGKSGSVEQMNKAVNSLLIEAVDNYQTRHKEAVGQDWNVMEAFEEHGIPVPGGQKPALELIDYSGMSNEELGNVEVTKENAAAVLKEINSR